MDAASRVVIVGGFCGQDGAMRVPGDQDAAVFLCPLIQAGFRLIFYMIVFSGAGRVKDSQIFQRPPEIADEETGKRPERGI